LLNLASVISQYTLKKNKNLEHTACDIAIGSLGIVSTSIYKVQGEKRLTSSYSLRSSITEDSILKSVSKYDAVQRKMLESVFPEITGAALGGLMMLTASIYSFSTGLASAGYALLGPAIAGIFGSVALWVLNRKAEKE
jgi:hypothetical protein